MCYAFWAPKSWSRSCWLSQTTQDRNCRMEEVCQRQQWPQCSCVTMPGSWQHCPLALYPQDQDQFPVEKSHGLRVRTVIYSPMAKTRDWGDSGCVCVPLLCKQPHTHEPIVETEAVWVAYEGRVCSRAQTQPPQQSGCFTSSRKNLPTTLLYLFPHKNVSWLPAPAERSELKGQAAGRAPLDSFCFMILHSCTARLWKKSCCLSELFCFVFFKKTARQNLQDQTFHLMDFTWSLCSVISSDTFEMLENFIFCLTYL